MLIAKRQRDGKSSPFPILTFNFDVAMVKQYNFF
ncbi:hypothetical protein GALL_536720 [mine drainage metagenome]|uniref:Uncharacterized protein n=1 Tax=mine drainage metagenome TaxID=410659 RepID=A0A1J5P2A5_9ZZZZ